MKFAVTGGAGFIGSHLARYLVSQSHDVIVIDSLYRGRMENLHDILDRIEFSKTDILNFESVKSTAKGVDGIFHQAALTSVPESYTKTDLYKKVNVKGTENIFSIARDFGIKVVYASSSSVYGNPETVPIKENAKREPINPYGVTKLEDEYLAEKYGTKGTHIIGLRYFNVYGPRQNPDYAGVISRFHENLSQRKAPVIFGDGSQIRDFVSVEDVAKANLTSFESRTENAFLNVGTGTGISIKDLADIMIGLSGFSLNPEYDKLPAGDVKQSIADTTQLERILGWKPKTSLKEGLEKFFFQSTSKSS